MNTRSRILAGLVGTAMFVQLQGCYGNFNLTRKLYTWNGQLGDKWINSIATWVMIVVPVYGVVGVVDFVVLNTIQFWTGQNPVTMNEGEKDIQVVSYKGKEYQMTATKNRLDVQEIADGKLQDPVSLVFDASTSTWSAVSGNLSQPLVEVIEGPAQVANLIYPDGHKQRMELVTQ